ncbi:RNA polymerase sigma factor [Georgenia sp. AZ-5]|uniref:RNA polymerase sigma factor n=1 Tax=Georgenia sp. AZ-5 TaxID=3367526 RepID=UPI0037542DD1
MTARPARPRVPETPAGGRAGRAEGREPAGAAGAATRGVATGTGSPAVGVGEEQPTTPPELAEAFRVLAHAQLPRLLSIARRLVGTDAEDAVQECLLKAFQHFGELHDPRAGPGWLTSILVNCCHDVGRARARRAEVDVDGVEEFSLFKQIAYEDPFPYSEELHLDFLREFGAEDVREVVRRLPLRYRTPLVLVYMDGYLVKEVAQMLDAPLGTVLSRLHRARRLFERQMWEYAEERGLLLGEGRP